MRLARSIPAALLAAFASSSCTTSPPPSTSAIPFDLRPTPRLNVVLADDAPGNCAQTHEFVYVGVSTLTWLGFGQSDDPDYSRPAKIWITYRAVSTNLPGVAAKRMLCLTYLDGGGGLQAMDVPEGWPEVLITP